MWEANKIPRDHSQLMVGSDGFLLEQGKFLEYVCTTVSSVGQNLCSLLSDLENPPEFLSLGPDLVNLQRETISLQENVECLVESFYGDRHAMGEILSEADELRNKYKNLQTEWDYQQEHLGRMQGELFKLRNQLQHQSQFCASLGAVMGNLVWKSSRNPSVVDLLLGGNKVGEFLCIASGTLVSFLDTYQSTMPTQNTDESQFITSMCGIVTNLAAAPSGRQFLVTHPNGIELIEQFIKLLPKIPSPSGNCLKRLILMALYNISINQNGLKILQSKKEVLAAISHSLQNDTARELKLMSLRLLQSITYEIDDQQLLADITSTIPLELVNEMSRSMETDMKIVAKDVSDNLQRARKIAQLTEDMSATGNDPPYGSAPYEECFFVQPQEQGGIHN